MSMREIAEGRNGSPPGGILVSFVGPGGLMVKPFAEGALLVRIFHPGGVLHLDAEDGLLAEMASGHDPVPWETREARDGALGWIRECGGLEDEQRARLLRHVRATPWYEADGA